MATRRGWELTGTEGEVVSFKGISNHKVKIIALESHNFALFLIAAYAR